MKVLPLRVLCLFIVCFFLAGSARGEEKCPNGKKDCQKDKQTAAATSEKLAGEQVLTRFRCDKEKKKPNGKEKSWHIRFGRCHCK